MVCDPVDEAALTLLRDAGIEVVYRPGISSEELIGEIGGFDVVVVRGRTKITSSVIDAGRALKIIGRAGTGLDNIDLAAAERRGIVVLNTPEAPVNAVAELVVGLMIAVARKIALADRLMKEGKWPKHELLGTELSGKVLGVIGFGRIGRRVAEIARAIGMRILAYDIIDIPREVLQQTDATLVDLDRLLSESDFITLHVPLTDDTRHMINEERLRRMKRGAVIVNASRGAVIDEEALYRALREGWIAGAALDVFEREPPVGSKLLELDNVVLTPHIGAETREAQRLAATLLAERIVSKLREMRLIG